MKKNNFKNSLYTIIISLSVFLLEINNTLAQNDNGLQGSLNFKAAANNITNNVLTSATTLLMTAAFVLFFYGVVRFIYDRSNGDDTRLEKDKEAMGWGLVALFVMVSTWGIIKLFQSYLGIQSDNNIQIQAVSFTPPPAMNTQGGNTTAPNTIKGDFKTVNPNTNPTVNDAKLIDQYLNQYKCFPNGVTSVGVSYDSGLDSPYVVAFQQANNISPTGIIDNTTWDAFKSGTANNCPDKSKDRPLVVPGVTLNYQTANLISKYLIQYKCFPKDINSIGITYDSYDAQYVKNFQKANGLVVDGKIGDNTWKAFDSNTAKSCQ